MATHWCESCGPLGNGCQHMCRPDWKDMSRFHEERFSRSIKPIITPRRSRFRPTYSHYDLVPTMSSAHYDVPSTYSRFLDFGPSFNPGFSHLDGQMRDIERQMEEFMQADMSRKKAIKDEEQKSVENPMVEDPQSGGEKFELTFDLSHYKPEEISIRTTGQQLTVHAKHEEKSDVTNVVEEYTREYNLPENVDAEKLTSQFSPEGVLTVEAPLPPKVEAPPVVQPPQPVAMTIQHNK